MIKNESDINQPSHVIGIGASAGGLEALEIFFKAIPTDLGIAFVVVQHLSPDFKTFMDELLARHTTMPVLFAQQHTLLQANTVYLLPPRKNIIVEANHLILHDRAEGNVLQLPINTFFQSLAEHWGENSVGVILSGTGSDGSAGIVKIHQAGGLTLTQDPTSAKFDGMPQSAIATNCIDSVSTLDVLANKIQAHLNCNDENVALTKILALLATHYHINFHYYKRSTIQRRIERRLNLLRNIDTIEQYQALLATDLNELAQLYHDLLIGVTYFYRDAEAFDLLRKEVLPNYLNNLSRSDEFRVWVCACSTGEEAYTLAILLLEVCEQLETQPKLKILATDIHAESLLIASKGIYHEESLAKLPASLVEKYFESQGNGLFKAVISLRNIILFSEHNVLTNPGYINIDLVSCRNMLIYFKPEAQTQVLRSLYSALNMNGFLLLGPSENLGNFADNFKVFNQQWKIFQKISHTPSKSYSNNYRYNHTELLPYQQQKNSDIPLIKLYDAVLANVIDSGLLLTESLEILHIFGNASQYLHLPTGRIDDNLSSMLDGVLCNIIRNAIRTYKQQQPPIVYKNVKHHISGNEIALDLTIKSITIESLKTTCFLILFSPKKTIPIENPIEKQTTFDVDNDANTYIKTLEHDLYHTQQLLQNTIEALESNTEELQSSNEELVSSNEELQSTNEELQSVNEELYSVNLEHEHKIEALKIASSDLNNLTLSTNIATIFIDTNYIIRLFTPQAAHIFPLLASDIGRDLRHFQPKHVDTNLFQTVDKVLINHQMLEESLQWENKTYSRRISPYYNQDKTVAGAVINYVDITKQKLAEIELKRYQSDLENLVEQRTKKLAKLHKKLQYREALANSIFETAPDAMLLINDTGCIERANTLAGTLFGFPQNALLGKSVEFLLPDRFRQNHARYRKKFTDQRQSGRMSERPGLFAMHADRSEFPVDIRLSPMALDGKHYVIATVIDISQQLKIETQLREAKQMADTASQTKSEFLANMSHEIRTPMNAILGFTEMLLEDEPTPQDQECLGKIHKASTTLLHIINDILDFSKIEAGRLEIVNQAFNLRQEIDIIASMFHERAQAKGLAFNIDIQPNVPEQVIGDVFRLTQVLNNLLSNALKFTDHGEIRLEISVPKLNTHDFTLQCIVIDTGIGISPQQQTRLFQAFSQGDGTVTRRYGGTGLGLVICQRLLQLMTGDICLESEESKGCRVTCTLQLGVA